MQQTTAYTKYQAPLHTIHYKLHPTPYLMNREVALAIRELALLWAELRKDAKYAPPGPADDEGPPPPALPPNPDKEVEEDCSVCSFLMKATAPNAYEQT